MGRGEFRDTRQFTLKGVDQLSTVAASRAESLRKRVDSLPKSVESLPKTANLSGQYRRHKRYQVPRRLLQIMVRRYCKSRGIMNSSNVLCGVLTYLLERQTFVPRIEKVLHDIV